MAMFKPQNVYDPISYSQDRNPENWTVQEDKLIITTIQTEGLKCWKQISQEILKRYDSERAPKKIRERWYNHLDPSLKKGPWDHYEEVLLFEKIVELGHRWCRIAKFIPGRNEHAVKNHYRRLMK
jgi:hypothetical protein